MDNDPDWPPLARHSTSVAELLASVGVGTTASGTAALASRHD
jgi:hypothetical protein